MESASKNRRRRGRPRVWSEDATALARFVSPNVKTGRALQNTSYRQLALRCLVQDPAFSWLCNGAKMEAGAPNAWKPGILSELGRFLDEETIRAFAARICELKPSTKEAIAMLRRARRQKGAPVSILKLTQQICRVIDTYVADHPGITQAQILMAIQNARDAVLDSHLS